MCEILRGAACIDLHQAEAAICHMMRHELKVARSYAWHVRSADRQAAACLPEKRNLQENEIVVWADYKHKYSLPVANSIWRRERCFVAVTEWNAQFWRPDCGKHCR